METKEKQESDSQGLLYVQKLSSLPGLEHLPHKGCWDSAEVTIRPCDVLWPETPHGLAEVLLDRQL